MRLEKYTTIGAGFCGLERGRYPSEGEGQTAFDRARSLRKIEHAAVAGQKWPVALREQIPDIDQGLHAIWQDAPAMDRLTQEKAEIGVVQIAIEGIDSSESARLLPAIRYLPLCACMLQLTAVCY